MSKKKNKIPKLTEEQYFAYIAGLKNEAALFDSDGRMVVPAPFNVNEGNETEKQGN